MYVNACMNHVLTIVSLQNPFKTKMAYAKYNLIFIITLSRFGLFAKFMNKFPANEIENIRLAFHL
jgi:hypothetical protein